MDQFKEMTITEKILALLVILFFVSLAFFINVSKESKQLNEEYEKKVTIATKIEKQNKQTIEKSKRQIESLGNDVVEKQSTRFYNLFFNWNSWEKYTRNMLAIQKEFPQLDTKKPVDITGNAVGNGRSPISSYKSKVYVTSDRGKIVTVATQLRNTDTSTQTTIWKGLTEVKDNLLYVRELSPYSKL
ncbi:hypothetical protein P9705_001268 [Enterococcus faecalis]|nr:hypothetical protein [Enterococcus faecalis]